MKNKFHLILLILTAACTQKLLAQNLPDAELFDSRVKHNIKRNPVTAAKVAKDVGVFMSAVYPRANEDLAYGKVILNYLGENKFTFNLQTKGEQYFCQIPDQVITMDRADESDATLYSVVKLDNTCRMTYQGTSTGAFHIELHRTYIDDFVYSGCERFCSGMKKTDKSLEYDFYHHTVSKKITDYLNSKK
jgi:hypothetical protein